MPGTLDARLSRPVRSTKTMVRGEPDNTNEGPGAQDEGREAVAALESTTARPTARGSERSIQSGGWIPVAGPEGPRPEIRPPWGF